MKASDLLVKCLEEEGTEYIFGVPGEENLDLVESIRTSKIKLIVNRHEQCSAFMAATYGRLTGKPGVCLSTLGPGATNLVTGIAHAQLGGMPVLAITGQKGIRDNVQANFQVLDVVGMMKPLTKRAVQIHSPRSIPKEVRMAFTTATTERQGVCHIELPEDIAGEDEPEGFVPHHAVKIRRPIADQTAIDLAVACIKNAKQPLIMVSSRAQRTRVHEALRSFCSATNLYVVHTQLGKGALGDDHPNSLFAFGMHKRDYVHCLIDTCDVIITVGYSPLEHPPSVWNKERKKKILHIDFTPAEPEMYYDPCSQVIGDIAASLDMLQRELQGYGYDASLHQRTRENLEEKLFKEGSNDTSFPLKPRRIVADCRAVLGKKDIVCLDNGIYKLWFSRHYKTYNICTFLLDNALATMGAGLPSAMAAKLVHPDRRVLAVCGDGGFMMNSQELETAVRLKLKIVILILNDNAYGFIKWKQKNAGFQNFGMDYTNPDFVKYAEAYGAKGYRVIAEGDLKKVLEQAFQQDGPVIVECPIDYSENVTILGDELDRITCGA
ncbi:acetolactate synthase large subunit [Candidatus Woesearchaeota archaeon]|nr:acetolactate synthase large subunit [Candidatus Woesearchaeota archaeon]